MAGDGATLPSDATSRLRRALDSLEGLSLGDALGEAMFASDEEAIRARQPAPGPWRWTDDTQMASAIVEVLARFGQINPDELAVAFGTRYDPHRSYGVAMHDLLPRYRYGADWRSAAQSLFYGQGSFGNGSAMRVAPLGAYFADDRHLLVEQAALSAAVTHAHPEAYAGAIAVALAAGYGAVTRQAQQPIDAASMFEYILSDTPGGAVHDGIAKAAELPADTPLPNAIATLGNGVRTSCPDTVPLTIWIAAHNAERPVDALWTTISAYGDMDTTTAIVLGILAAHTGPDALPSTLIAQREPLPDWLPTA